MDEHESNKYARAWLGCGVVCPGWGRRRVSGDTDAGRSGRQRTLSATGYLQQLNRRFRKWRMSSYRLGGQHTKWIMSQSAIFKMADRSTINLYASGGGGGSAIYEIIYSVTLTASGVTTQLFQKDLWAARLFCCLTKTWIKKKPEHIGSGEVKTKFHDKLIPRTPALR